MAYAGGANYVSQVRRVLVDPPPTLWDHVKGAAAHVGSVTAKLAKKGVKKGLVKWLGEARYVEIEEKAAKAALASQRTGRALKSLL